MLIKYINYSISTISIRMRKKLLIKKAGIYILLLYKYHNNWNVNF